MKKDFPSCLLFASDTKYFEPSQKEFMVNFRVRNLETLVETLAEEGAAIVDTIETYEYGKFVHVMDPERTKIELWESADNMFHKMIGHVRSF